MSSGEKWIHTAAIMVTIVGASVSVALWMQSESYKCKIAVMVMSDRQKAMEERIYKNGWSRQDMHWFTASLRAAAGHDVPDIREID